MKILFVIGALDPAHGGPVRSALGLFEGSKRIGVDCVLLSLYPEGERNTAHGRSDVLFGSAHSYRGYKGALVQAIQNFRPSIIYIHGCWLPCHHAAAVVSREMKIPYVIAPRGSFFPWSIRQKALKKRIALWLYQRKDMICASAFHATSLDEVTQMKRWFPAVQTFCVPNGVIIPEQLPPWLPPKEGAPLRFISVSRVHYAKGYELLFQALKRVNECPWTLDIIGSGDDVYILKLKSLRDDLGLKDRIHFRGEMDDREKWIAYRQADVFLLATHSENFGISIAEALYAELPVLTTKGAPWKDLETFHCGWWVERTENELAEALYEICRTPRSDLRQMGKRAQALILEKYTWGRSARTLRENLDLLVRR